MQKITNILLTLAFTVGCVGLWLLLTLFQSIVPPNWPDIKLPGLTAFCSTNKFFFLIIPIPFLLLSAFFTFKKKPTTEINLIYLAILAVIYLILFFSVLVAALLPLIPLVE